MRTFLLLWNPGQNVVMHDQIAAFLDTRLEIKNWFSPFVGTILLVTDLTQVPGTVAETIRSRFAEFHFAVTPVEPWGTQGWMPKLFWDLVQQPFPSKMRAGGSLGDFLKLASPPPPPPPPTILPKK